MQIRVQQGSLPENAEKLTKLVGSRPFTHQLDVVFTAPEDLTGLLALHTSYYRAKLTFATVFSTVTSENDTTVTVLSVGSLATEDVWCLDTREVLTLSLTKDTYERLGIVGSSVGSSRRKDRFLVTLDLRDNTSRLAVRARDVLQQWDARRAEAGEDGWDVLLSSSLPFASRPEIKRDVKPLSQTSVNVHIPVRALPPIQSEFAHEELSALFEWVGLACLGSPRLDVNDASSSYVASYDPPAGSSSGNVTCLRWTGFLGPTFMHSVLKEVLSKGFHRNDSLVAITAVSFDAPVSCISGSGTTQGGENTWSLIISKEGQGSTKVETNWILAEADR